MEQSIALLRESVVDVSLKLSLVTARVNEVIQHISAMQMATNADNAAIEAIFPECRKKPYCVRSSVFSVRARI